MPDDDDRPKKKIVHEIGQDLTLLSVRELQEAGVLQVFDSLVAFRQTLNGTPLTRASR